MKTPDQIREDVYKKAMGNLSPELKHFVRFVAQLDYADLRPVEFERIQAHARGLVDAIVDTGMDSNDYVIMPDEAQNYGRLRLRPR